MKKNTSFSKTLVRNCNLFLRPFIDFYFNYGLARASVLSYVLCANLIIFVYCILSIGLTIAIDPLVLPSSCRRFLELHFLWPAPDKIFLEKVPPGFPLIQGSMVPVDQYEKALAEYSAQYNIPPSELKDENKLKAPRFSITAELGNSLHSAIQVFYDPKGRPKMQPLGIGFFTAIGIAYFALLLSIKTNLAESVSPLIWGNLPLANRKSEIMKILWRIPDTDVIKTRVYLFFMLPVLIVMAIALMSYGYYIIDWLLPLYSRSNTIVGAILSWIITTALFASLYLLHVTGISKKNAIWGALIASALWLAGRWFFTTYGAVSLYRNLRNFAFIPMFLTWFYYFCTVFLFGLYVSDTLENPNLSSTSRSWVMRDISIVNRYGVLSVWIRLDFLYRLAKSRYEEYRPPFLGIKVEDDTAAEIARKSNLHPSFVRECILEMLVRHKRSFHIEVEGNRQYCKLKFPPDEVEVNELLTDPEDIRLMLDEMDQYSFGQFIFHQYGTRWQAKPLMLSDVYHAYQDFAEKNQ